MAVKIQSTLTWSRSKSKKQWNNNRITKEIKCWSLQQDKITKWTWVEDSRTPKQICSSWRIKSTDENPDQKQIRWKPIIYSQNKRNVECF